MSKAASFVSEATPSPTRTARKPVLVPKGVTAGYVVFDRQARKVTVFRNVHKRFRSASVVKLLIAIDHLEDVAKPDLALLQPMLRVSDDNAATALWRRGGQGKIILRMSKRLGLTDTGPPPADKPGFWGYTAISALDIAKVYRYLLEKAEPKVRDTIMTQLRKAGQCGSDGFDQFFGIPRAVPKPWAVKQGWSGYGSVPPSTCVRARAASADVDFVHPVLHTTGVLGDRYIMVLLTTQTTPWADATKKITKLVGDVYRAAL
ncbi:lipoprotein [Acrocarpospora phusangensis]|uniref:Lipoprotein n=1 Tax=Acrocarpospora phusangensis TaxID=1070424 RepID=A0A919QG81_9ACTN|nr:lipoprotein [Acrocarpospora phusangensis]